MSHRNRVWTLLLIGGACVLLRVAHQGMQQLPPPGLAKFFAGILALGAYGSVAVYAAVLWVLHWRQGRSGLAGLVSRHALVFILIIAVGFDLILNNYSEANADIPKSGSYGLVMAVDVLTWATFWIVLVTNGPRSGPDLSDSLLFYLVPAFPLLREMAFISSFSGVGKPATDAWALALVTIGWVLLPLSEAQQQARPTTTVIAKVLVLGGVLQSLWSIFVDASPVIVPSMQIEAQLEKWIPLRLNVLVLALSYLGAVLLLNPRWPKSLARRFGAPCT